MSKLPLAAAISIAALFSAPAAQAQGRAPWPPPPGMTAGEYAARYGHLITPDDHAGRPRYGRHWDQERSYGRPERRRWRERHYYDDED